MMKTDEMRSGALPAPFLATVTGLVLCVLVPLIVCAFTPSGAQSSWPGAVFSIIIAGARFTWIVGSSSRRLFEMATWLFFYVFFGVAPLAQLRSNVDPTTTPNVSHVYDSTAWSIVIASELCLIIGSHYAHRRAISRSLGLRLERAVDEARTVLMSVVLSASGLLFIAVTGVSQLFQSRADRGQILLGTIRDQTALTVILAVVSVGLLVAVAAQIELRRDRLARGRRAPVVLLGASLLILVAINNPFASARFLFITVTLGILASVGAYGKVTSFRWIALGSVAGLIILFPVLDSFRYAVGDVKTSNPLNDLLSGDFDAYAQLVNTVWSVDNLGLTWGYQALGVLLFWVPRTFWPTKPQDTGILLGQQKGYDFTNLSAPLPAEMYINFGWPAVIVGMLAVGYLLRMLDELNSLRFVHSPAPTLLGCVLPFYLVFLWRGSLLQATSNLAVIVVVWLLCTRRAVAWGHHDDGLRPRSRDELASRSASYRRPEIRRGERQ